MKMPLNKAYIPQMKTQEQTMPNMNPKLQKVFDIANGLQKANPETRAEYMKGLSQALSLQEEAEKAKETVTNEAEFNKACNDAVYAREKEQFYRRMIDDFDHTPRMNENEYFAAIDSVKAVVNDAAETYRNIARNAMSELVKARNEYIQIINDADRVLISLDAAANVLQSKYRYRTTEYADGTITYTEDRGEWARHCIRFANGEGISIVKKDPAKENIADPWDKVVCAAWNAAERVTK